MIVGVIESPYGFSSSGLILIPNKLCGNLVKSVVSEKIDVVYCSLING